LDIGHEIEKLVDREHTLKVAKSVVDLIEVIDRDVVIPVVAAGHSIGVPHKAAREMGWEALGDMLIELLSLLSALATRQLLVIVRHVLNVGMSIKFWNRHARTVH
jgi:hypothetical protein